MTLIFVKIYMFLGRIHSMVRKEVSDILHISVDNGGKKDHVPH